MAPPDIDRSGIRHKIDINCYKVIAKKNGRSRIWKLMSRIQTDKGTILSDWVYCKICRNVLKYSFRQTSNLIRHKCYMRYQKIQENTIINDPIDAIDNSKLIDEIVKVRPIWDVNNLDYENPSIVQCFWDEISHILNCDVDSIKNRWILLKDQYMNELKKTNSENSQTNSYAHALSLKGSLLQKLDFLRPTVKNFPPDEQINETSSKISVDVNSNNSLNAKLRDTDTELQQDIQGNLKNNLETPPVIDTNSNRTNKSADNDFLMSFLPYMETMTEMGKLNFRLEMSKLLIKIKEQECLLK